MGIDTFFWVLVLLYILGYLLYILYYAMGLFHWNPFVKLKGLSVKEQIFLAEHFTFYNDLPLKTRKTLEERIIWFRSRKRFVFYGKVSRQEELKLLLSASAVFMSLGLKDYKMMRSLLGIIVYPTQYYSKINRRHHLGEYNPRLKTAVFSADKIWEGFAHATDNKNLAMHEFAHALFFEMTKGGSWEARKFRVGLKKIQGLFQQPAFVHKIRASNYFRDYGLSSLHEFFSVAVENYVETPTVFRNGFPELYAIMQTMLNFDFQQIPQSPGFKNVP